jgi:hypothetical protein
LAVKPQKSPFLGQSPTGVRGAAPVSGAYNSPHLNVPLNIAIFRPWTRRPSAIRNRGLKEKKLKIVKNSSKYTKILTKKLEKKHKMR